jgi:hypothetical protein
MNTSKDSEFIEVENLKWLPFVGDNYFQTDKRVMIIGESHYRKDDKNSIKRSNDNKFTREIVDDIAILKNYYKTKFFQNLYKTLFRTDNINTVELWKKICFYNFIQRPMTTSLERPSKSDYKEAWKVYFKLIKLTSPELCIFIGVGAFNSIWSTINKTNYSIISHNHSEKINNTFPREVIIKDKDGKEIKLVFIKHTSQFYSWKLWNGYLRESYESEMDWLKAGIWENR